LLLGIARIGRVNLVEVGQMNLTMKAEQQPSLVLVDFEPGNEMLQTTLHRMKESWPGTLRIVLVENEAERRAAAKSGGDLVLIKGLLAARLAGSIEEALARQTGDHRT